MACSVAECGIDLGLQNLKLRRKLAIEVAKAKGGGINYHSGWVCFNSLTPMRQLHQWREAARPH